MAYRVWLFGLILAVPLVGFMASEGIQRYFNSELRALSLKRDKPGCR